MLRVVKVIVIFNFIFLFSSCVFSERTAQRDYSDAVDKAEEFMSRNGFTPKGHPPNLPVNVVESLDRYLLSNESDREKLLKARKGRIPGPAYCVSNKHDGKYVSFSKPDGDCQVVVKVSENDEVTLLHGCISLEFLNPCDRL